MENSIRLTSFKGQTDISLPKWKKCLALLHPLTLKRLQLKICSPIAIKTVNGDVLLKSWPCNFLEESVAALPGLSLFKHYACSKASVEDFEGVLFPANRIVLSPVENKKFIHTKSFKAFLLDYLDCIYIQEGMILHIEFLGYPCSFTVKKISSNLLENDFKETNNDEDSSVSLDLSNVDNSEEDSFLIGKSFSEKCNISKHLKTEAHFQSSTPISSPKALLQSKTGLQSIHCPDLESLEWGSVQKTFYRMHMKTKIFFQVPDSLQKPKKGVKFEDIGSLEDEKKYIKLLCDSLLNYDKSTESKGIIVIGPPGTGKSMIAKAIQNEYQQKLPVYFVTKHLFVCDGNITKLKKAIKGAEENSPSIIILDNIDQIRETETSRNSPKNWKALAHEISAVIEQLLTSVPDIILLATSQNESSIFANLQKHVSCIKELRIPVPSLVEREKICMKVLKNYDNNLTVQDISNLSEMAHGFTGRDLVRLCDKAEKISGKRTFHQSKITFLSLVKSLQFIKPSSMEELKFEVPNVRWSDIGGMEEVKNAVKEMADWPLRYPEQFKKLNITPSRGILMYGPPGCCKTMIAKALATESQLNFIYLKQSQVFSMYVGDSEKSVSEVFKKARAAAPCILFFDEVESMAPKRGSSSRSSNVADRVITQILIELDGIDVLEEGVCVIAATNQPHKIDPSLLRPGRLDHLIYVPLPDAATRKEIFEVILRKKPVSSHINISYLVNKTEGFTGAEIADLCSQACLHVIKEDIASTTSVVEMKHFEMSLATLKPRTTQEMIHVFETYKNNKLL